MKQCFRVCGVSVALEGHEHDVVEVLALVFGGLPTDRTTHTPDLHYILARNLTTGALTIVRNGSEPLAVQSLGDLLFQIDKDLTVALQRLRADLFFMHAGVVAANGRAWAISAPSGTGKSTTVWALVRDGLDYMSDELAPIEATSDMRVHPYPRALHLKREPGHPYGVPASAVRFPDGLYIPTAAMPKTPQTDALPLCGMFFLRRDAERNAPRTKHLSPAEAAGHLYANALNPLAHAGMGLDAAIAIAERVPCLEIELGALSASVAEIQRCMHEAVD